MSKTNLPWQEDIDRNKKSLGVRKFSELSKEEQAQYLEDFKRIQENLEKDEKKTGSKSGSSSTKKKVDKGKELISDVILKAFPTAFKGEKGEIIIPDDSLDVDYGIKITKKKNRVEVEK